MFGFHRKTAKTAPIRVRERCLPASRTRMQGKLPTKNTFDVPWFVKTPTSGYFKGKIRVKYSQGHAFLRIFNTADEVLPGSMTEF